MQKRVEYIENPVNKVLALWALTEAGLGGVFHAFRMPFTGLLIAGMAVLFISLIAFLSKEDKGQIIRATIIVLIIKMVISPHTPPTAYIAVLFQGLIAYALFRFIGVRKFTVILLSVLALLESGFQKIFTLTLFYGVSLWDSIDSFYEFIQNELRISESVSGTQLIAGIYFGIYLLSAIVFAFLTLDIISNLKSLRPKVLEEFKIYLLDHSISKQKKKKKLIGRRTWLGIILLFIISILLIFNPESGWEKAVYVFFRAVTVILIWYTLIAPLIKKLIERFLSKQKKKYAGELSDIMAAFPMLRSVVFFALEKTGRVNSLSKLKAFFSLVIFLTLHAELKSDEINRTDNRTG